MDISSLDLSTVPKPDRFCIREVLSKYWNEVEPCLVEPCFWRSLNTPSVLQFFSKQTAQLQGAWWLSYWEASIRSPSLRYFWLWNLLGKIKGVCIVAVGVFPVAKEMLRGVLCCQGRSSTSFLFCPWLCCFLTLWLWKSNLCLWAANLSFTLWR